MKRPLRWLISRRRADQGRRSDMDKITSLEKRVGVLEEIVGSLTVVVNKLMEDIYEPEFMEKIDKLARYGKEIEEN